MRIERSTQDPVQVQSYLGSDGKTYYKANLYGNFKEKIDAEGNVHYECDAYSTTELLPFVSRESAVQYYTEHFDSEYMNARGAEERDDRRQKVLDARENLANGDYVHSKAVEELIWTDITLDAWRAKYRKEYGRAWHANREEQRDIING